MRGKGRVAWIGGVARSPGACSAWRSNDPCRCVIVAQLLLALQVGKQKIYS